MPDGSGIVAAGLESARLRSAGKDRLSLALIDVRNRSLAWAAALEAAGSPPGREPGRSDGANSDDAGVAAVVAEAPLWRLGHVAWFQEYWIGRNVQRGRGERADPDLPRLASILPGADDWFASPSIHRGDDQADPVDRATIRQYLLDTLEASLDTLAATPDETDDALYFHRLVLMHEEMQVEAFAVFAQSFGLRPPEGLLERATSSTVRPPLQVPATRWLLGGGGEGFRFDNEREAHAVEIPEFEIDAQPIRWTQYGEFVEDGGYDEPSFWSPAGREWLRQGRRTPRHVEQMRRGVVQRRFGLMTRLPNDAPVMHVNCHEAEAWCRWAGRRLPGEAEWEAAAHQAASRGFRFGEVREWTATTFRPYPGFVAGPWRGYSVPSFGVARVLRGASFATPPALRSTRFRGFASPDCDEGFFGFRSCAA
ncbi:MAG TPA: SUMF1/EgtB/PvdO family nonheme iron enzyme [Caldimonas sp.]|nr:SUMF1/EgtB/PvdO family nonheme iron enzyme [Caldimonas sp.]